MAQIFSWIIFLLQKKIDFSCSNLSARMHYVGKFLQNSQEINKMCYSQQLLTSYPIKHLSQWLKCQILSYWPWLNSNWNKLKMILVNDNWKSLLKSGTNLIYDSSILCNVYGFLYACKIMFLLFFCWSTILLLPSWFFAT